MRPQQNGLNHQVGSAVDDHVLPHDHHNERDDQVAAVGIGERGLLHLVELERLFEHRDKHEEQALRGQRANDGDKKAQSHLLGHVHLKRRNDHAGVDDVEVEHGDGAAVLWLHETRFDQGKPHRHHHEQRQYFLSKNQTQHDAVHPFLCDNPDNKMTQCTRSFVSSRKWMAAW